MMLENYDFFKLQGSKWTKPSKPSNPSKNGDSSIFHRKWRLKSAISWYDKSFLFMFLIYHSKMNLTWTLNSCFVNKNTATRSILCPWKRQSIPSYSHNKRQALWFQTCKQILKKCLIPFNESSVLRTSIY